MEHEEETQQYGYQLAVATFNGSKIYREDIAVLYFKEETKQIRVTFRATDHHGWVNAVTRDVTLHEMVFGENVITSDDPLSYRLAYKDDGVSLLVTRFRLKGAAGQFLSRYKEMGIRNALVFKSGT